MKCLAQTAPALKKDRERQIRSSTDISKDIEHGEQNNPARTEDLSVHIEQVA